MNRLKELNILFLEDNEGFAKNTIDFLNIYFKAVFHSSTIDKALKRFNQNRIDVIISDINVSDGNGLDFIEKIRKCDSNVPIIVLSAHKDENFLFKAIPLNITSYELKPISYDGFMLLLNKLLFKFESRGVVNICDGLDYDFSLFQLIKVDQQISLTKKEIKLIELMLMSEKKVVTKDMIQNIVWEDELMSDSGLKNLIFRLRKKVGKDFILTVQDVGYKFNKY
jgi:DNA-binding response OmpR family regulator